MRMKSADQGSLEFLYEQVVEGDTCILKKEKEYAKLTAEQIVKEATKAIKRRISNRGKIRGESLADFISPLLISQGEQAFKNEVPNLILSIYASMLRLDVFMELIYFTSDKPADRQEEDIDVVIIEPTMLTQTSGSAEKKIISFLDKQALQQEIQRVIEQTIVIRYNQCFSPIASKYISANKQVWANWRIEELKYEKIKTKLPELEGIF